MSNFSSEWANGYNKALEDSKMIVAKKKNNEALADIIDKIEKLKKKENGE